MWQRWTWDIRYTLLSSHEQDKVAGLMPPLQPPEAAQRGALQLLDALEARESLSAPPAHIEPAPAGFLEDFAARFEAEGLEQVLEPIGRLAAQSCALHPASCDQSQSSSPSPFSQHPMLVPTSSIMWSLAGHARQHACPFEALAVPLYRMVAAGRADLCFAQQNMMDARELRAAKEVSSRLVGVSPLGEYARPLQLLLSLTAVKPIARTYTRLPQWLPPVRDGRSFQACLLLPPPLLRRILAALCSLRCARSLYTGASQL